MPLSKHFGGKGEKVMASMKKTYGPEKAKSIFYATENKKNPRGDDVHDSDPLVIGAGEP